MYSIDVLRPVFVSLLLCFGSFAVSAQAPITFTPGEGVFAVGAARANLEAVVGTPSRIGRRNSDVYFIEYLNLKLQVAYKVGEDTVAGINFFRRSTNEKSPGGPPLRTAKGITWDSTAKQIREAYGDPAYKLGQPTDDFGALRYKDVSFTFKSGRLIVVTTPGRLLPVE